VSNFKAFDIEFPQDFTYSEVTTIWRYTNVYIIIIITSNH